MAKSIGRRVRRRNGQPDVNGVATMPRVVTWYAALAFVTGIATATTAHGTELSGSFVGIAHSSGPPSSLSPYNVEGEAVTGTFDFDPVFSGPNTSTPPNYNFYYDRASFLDTPDSRGTYQVTYSILLGGTAVTRSFSNVFAAQASVSNGEQAISQSVNLTSGNFYNNVVLSLAGSGFFDLSDPAALMPGQVNYSSPNTYIAISERFTLMARVQLTSVTFGAVSVPEPPGVALLLLGIAGLGAVRARSTPPRLSSG